jgi:hypothetical protein
MYVGAVLEGLFFAFFVAVASAGLLALYGVWQTFFSLTPWEVCVKMDTDAAKVQCMEAHYE